MPLLTQFVVVLIAAIIASLLAWFIARRLSRPLALSDRLANLVVLSSFIVYVLAIGALALLRHESLHSWYDLAVYDQTIWNSLNGRLFENTIQYDNPHFLGFHFSPILLAFIPLYAIWPDARMLLISQTAILAFTAFPLFWYARKELGNVLAVILVVALLLSPALQYINLYDFHEIAVATPLLALATFFLLRRRDAPFLVCAGLLLLIKEETALIIFGFGAWKLIVERRLLFGTLLGVGSLVSLVVLVSYVIPHYSAHGYPIIGAIYGALGNTFPEIVTTMITRPDKVIELVLMSQKVAFVLYLFVPVAFVPLLGLEVTALSFPTLAYLLVSDPGPRTEIEFHYTATLLPFLFFGAAVGLRRLATFQANGPRDAIAPRRAAALGALVMAASALGYFMFAPGPLARRFDASVYALDARALAGRSLIALVPPGAKVVAQKEHLPQFSDRAGVYDFPSIPDYRQADYVFAEPGRFWYDFHKGWWEEWLSNTYFQIIASEQGYVLAARRPLQVPLQIRFDDKITLLGYSIVMTDTLRGGQTLRPIVGWRAERPIASRFRMRVELVDRQGHLWSADENEPQGGALPTDLWQVGQYVGDHYALALPVTMPSGEYQVRLGVDDPASERLIARDAEGRTIGQYVPLASVQIAKNKQSFVASELVAKQLLEQPYYVDMAEMRLIGFKSLPSSLTAGDQMSVGVYWRARQKPQTDYSVAVQLRDATEAVLLEHKQHPANGTYPTSLWAEGEVLLDWHDLALPETLPAGEYSIHVVLASSLDGRVEGDAKIGTVNIRRR